MPVENTICTPITNRKLFPDMHPGSFGKRPEKPGPKYNGVNVTLRNITWGKRSEIPRTILVKFEKRSSRTEQVHQNSSPPFLEKFKFVGWKTAVYKTREL